MKLNIPERIAILNVLPREGSIITLRVIRELQINLSFSEAEIEHLGIENHTLPDGGVSIIWNPKLTDETKDIDVGKAAKGIIVEHLKKLDSTGRLHITMIPLYEKFVEQTQ
ncbi:hypothetical protein MUP59_02030 [Candidatus Bathyarchaeota archaeon]|nr:hypothetical protein [Candidatus Bathyarchaeota archaeon]